MPGGPWAALINRTYRAISVEASRCMQYTARGGNPCEPEALASAGRRGRERVSPAAVRDQRPEAGRCSTGLETAAARRRVHVRRLLRPGQRFSQCRCRCQGDRRRTFPRWAPPPGQSDRLSLEPRFSLFRSHFRPGAGGNAASAEGPRPEASGMVWDRVGDVRVRLEGGSGDCVPKLADRQRGEAPDSPPSGSPPDRLEPGGGGCAVRSPTAATPRVLRNRGRERASALQAPKSRPGALQGGGKERVSSGKFLPLPIRRWCLRTLGATVASAGPQVLGTVQRRRYGRSLSPPGFFYLGVPGPQTIASTLS